MEITATNPASTAAAGESTRLKEQSIAQRFRSWPAMIILLLGAGFMLFPFIWMFLTSVKSVAESNQYPPTVWPTDWLWENYRSAWTMPPSTLGRYILNSFVISSIGTLGQLAVGVLAAYAFSRLRFRGRDLLFMLVLATSLIPSEISIIPNYITINHFPLFGGNDILGQGGNGIYNTYAAMILPGMAGAFQIFLLRQSFLQIPADLWEASQLDGGGSWQFLTRIVLPLSIPALVTVFIFGFIGRWNALLWPMLVTSSEHLRPVQLAMTYYQQSEFLSNQGATMAASLLVTAPIILLYVIVQRQFVEGIGTTGLKG
jgi:multiple sugar transport system permease protein